jgi:hypothetical protein
MSIYKTALAATAFALVAASANAQAYSYSSTTVPVQKPSISADARKANASLAQEKAPFSREALERFGGN